MSSNPGQDLWFAFRGVENDESVLRAKAAALSSTILFLTGKSLARTFAKLNGDHGADEMSIALRESVMLLLYVADRLAFKTLPPLERALFFDALYSETANAMFSPDDNAARNQFLHLYAERANAYTALPNIEAMTSDVAKRISIAIGNGKCAVTVGEFQLEAMLVVSALHMPQLLLGEKG